ncbi:MAG: PD40 domain-containing protein, partial [Candidatus Krumholzibacteria bacterium]|nr:PD40 domain-containing protein [Candidatus Krumholzibacteria bacterium]
MAVFGWVPDASSLWTFVRKPDGTAQIASIDLTDGTFNVLKTLDYRNHSQPPSLSPDGRLITYYDRPDRESPPDVFLLATDGSGEFRVEHPASDSKPIFAPDGSGIVFESDRRGARDLWFLPVADGMPSGAPRIVWRDVGPYGQVLRFAENGSLFYVYTANEFAVYTAEIDVLNQTIDNVEVLTPRHRQMNTAPAWSSDGRWLAYRRGGRRVVLRELATGVEREVAIPGGRGGVDWCGSATSLVVSGYDDGPAAYRVVQGSTEVERLPLNRPDKALCVTEGEAIVYHRRVGDRGSQVGQIVRHFLSSGQESVLFEGPVSSGTMARSPDGRHLAFLVADSVVARLVVMPSTGGEPRELLTSSYYEYPDRSIQISKLIN